MQREVEAEIIKEIKLETEIIEIIVTEIKEIEMIIAIEGIEMKEKKINKGEKEKDLIPQDQSPHLNPQLLIHHLLHKSQVIWKKTIMNNNQRMKLQIKNEYNS